MVDETGGSSPFTVAHFLLGLNFPADRARMIDHARRRNANREVIAVLERLPERRYDGMAEVEEALKQLER